MSPVDNPVRIRGILRSVTVDRPGDSGELPASGGENAQLSWFPVMNCLWITDSSVNPRLAWGYSALPARLLGRVLPARRRIVRPGFVVRGGFVVRAGFVVRRGLVVWAGLVGPAGVRLDRVDLPVEG